MLSGTTDWLFLLQVTKLFDLLLLFVFRFRIKLIVKHKCEQKNPYFHFFLFSIFRKYILFLLSVLQWMMMGSQAVF